MFAFVILKGLKPHQISMLHYLNKKDFSEYMDMSGEHHIYHPYDNLDFRSFHEGKGGKFFCKSKHGKEFPIDKYERKYLDALSYHIIVPPEDYVKF